jgi:transposase
MHVLVASVVENRLVLEVESDQTLDGCPACGVVAVDHGRRVHRLHDVPCFGRPVLIRWRKRIWRCTEPACPVETFSPRPMTTPAVARS